MMKKVDAASVTGERGMPDTVTDSSSCPPGVYKVQTDMEECQNRSEPLSWHNLCCLREMCARID